MNRIHFAIIVFTLTAFAAGQPVGLIAADEGVQAELSRLVTAGPNKLQFYESVLQLKQLKTDKGERHLIEQALYFDSTVERRRSGPRGLRYVIWQVQGGKELMAPFIAMRFWDAPDAGLRDRARQFVLNEDLSAGPRDGFLIHQVWELRSNPPQEIVQSLMARDPGLILRSLTGRSAEDEPPADPDETRNDLLGEHIIADADWYLQHGYDVPDGGASAIRELDRLSRGSKWWARLYAAEMLRRHESFRREDLVKSLRADDNPLVVRTVDEPYYPGMTDGEIEALKKSHPGAPVRPK